MKNPELINELGPKNQYVTLAGKSQVLGTKYHDSELILLGKQLGKLIATIPFDSDKFYLVIAKSKEVENKIKEIKKTTESILEGFKEKDTNWKFNFLRDNKANRFIVEIDNWRMFPTDTSSTYRDKILKMLLAGIDLSKLHSEEFNDRAQYAEGNSKTIYYKDKQGKIIYSNAFHIHEYDAVGMNDRIYYDDFEKARDAWGKIRKIFKAEAKK